MVTWTRLIYNGGEPDNRLHFHGVQEGDELDIHRVSFAGLFRDGFMNCGLDRNEDGTWLWHLGDKEGVCESYAEAWANLPAYITHPDHWEWAN